MVPPGRSAGRNPGRGPPSGRRGRGGRVSGRQGNVGRSSDRMHLHGHPLQKQQETDGNKSPEHSPSPRRPAVKRDNEEASLTSATSKKSPPKIQRGTALLAAAETLADNNRYAALDPGDDEDTTSIDASMEESHGGIIEDSGATTGKEGIAPASIIGDGIDTTNDEQNNKNNNENETTCNKEDENDNIEENSRGNKNEGNTNDTTNDMNVEETQVCTKEEQADAGQANGNT